MNRNEQLNLIKKNIKNEKILTSTNKLIHIYMIKKLISEQFKNLQQPVYLKYNKNVLYI